jgi:shikimate dehydrogenase
MKIRAVRKFGLIGYPLSHSFSQRYFTEKFRREKIVDVRYENYPIASVEELPELITSVKDLAGLNVTIPYKEKVIPYLDELSGDAAQVKAVNTIRIIRENDRMHLVGYNTDTWGFEETLRPLLRPWHTFALVLGTGGAAKAVGYVLDRLGMEVWYLSRRPRGERTIRYEELTGPMLQQIKLLVNTTPLGMFPETGTCPDIPYQYLTPEHLLYDLVYNPGETLFMKLGKEKGAAVANGLEMLKQQAEKAWEIWNDER